MLTPEEVGVELETQEEIDRWITLAKLEHEPSRYPDDAALHMCGIQQCFWELCGVGHLTMLFEWYQESYHQLTLEFLNTLKVTLNRTRVSAFSFRLFNVPMEFPMRYFNDMFGFQGTRVTEPPQFDKHAFWNAITLTENPNEKFNAARAKSTMISNPVLRYLQKACAYLPFARKQHGSILADELFLLWSVLHNRPLDMGHFIIKHLERQSKKTSGTLCCGGIIATIAVRCEYNISNLVPDEGEKFLTMVVLKSNLFMNVDRNFNGYFIQRAGDHFRILDPINTYVNGPDFTTNWQLNAQAHRNIVENMPPQRPWKDPRFHPNVPFFMPLAHRPDQPPLMQIVDAPQPEEHEDPQPRAQDSAFPRQRGRGRQRGGEAEDEPIQQRMDNLQEMMLQGFDQINHRFDALEANQRAANDWQVRMEQMFNSWNPHPPPPPP